MMAYILLFDPLTLEVGPLDSLPLVSLFVPLSVASFLGNLTLGFLCPLVYGWICFVRRSGKRYFVTVGGI